MAVDPITAIVEAGKTVLNKVFRDKASEAEITQIQQNFELEILRESTKENTSFREFILAYEGAAKDSPKLIQYFRSLIRPVFTCLVGYLDWLFFTTVTATWGDEKVALLKAVNIIVLLFWFGERAVKNSGVIDILKTKKSS